KIAGDRYQLPLQIPAAEPVEPTVSTLVQSPPRRRPLCATMDGAHARHPGQQSSDTTQYVLFLAVGMHDVGPRLPQIPQQPPADPQRAKTLLIKNLAPDSCPPQPGFQLSVVQQDHFELQIRELLQRAGKVVQLQDRKSTRLNSSHVKI